MWKKFLIFSLIIATITEASVTFNSTDLDGETKQPSNVLSQGYRIRESTGPNNKQPYTKLSLYTKDAQEENVLLKWEDLPPTDQSGLTLDQALNAAQTQGFFSTEQEMMFWKCIMCGGYTLATEILNIDDYNQVKQHSKYVELDNDKKPIPQLVLVPGENGSPDTTKNVYHGKWNLPLWLGNRFWIVYQITQKKFEASEALREKLFELIVSTEEKVQDVIFSNGAGDLTWGDGAGDKDAKNCLGKILKIVSQELYDQYKKGLPKKTTDYDDLMGKLK